MLDISTIVVSAFVCVCVGGWWEKGYMGSSEMAARLGNFVSRR
jgi:hypothetical protein